MGIIKISDELHEELRKASGLMARSINAQAEFWIKMGMQAELNPDRSFNELMAELYQREAIKVPGAQNA
ncbi:ParD-like family protein [Shewanella chilikensis]|uniref:ParD-like family protein n=1 Tax=Shewanella chilikensis TaxID=558541 RepID=UPI00399BF12B